MITTGHSPVREIVEPMSRET